MENKNTTVSSSSNRFFRFLKGQGFQKGSHEFWDYEKARGVLPKTSEPRIYQRMMKWTAKYLDV